jgi:tetratricopeptide (TPR) repeat protein
MEAATMTQTLNLFDELLLRARRLHEAGQWREALALLGRLSRFNELPPTIAEEAHARQGEILLKKRRYRAARRHLRAALHFAPEGARHHFLLGLCLHADPDGNREQAARHYRRSLELAPEHIRCRGEAGLLAIEQGLIDEGLALLRQAVEQAPADSGAVGRLIKGLFLAGRPDEALAAVRLALFRCPRNSALRKLWLDLQFAGIRRQQMMQAACARSEADAPMILPFVQSADRQRSASPWRHDAASSLPGPHLVRIRARTGRRRAP